MKLKILEAYTRDVGRGVARIDYDTMDKMECSTGDVCLITCGENTMPVKILPLYPSDEGKGIIRVDGLIRSNLKTSIGESCDIKRIKTVAAETINVYALQAVPSIDSRYITDALESVVVQEGQLLMVPYFGGRLNFKVTGTNPDGPVVITQKTIATIDGTDHNPELKMIIDFVTEAKTTVSKTSFDKIKELIKTKEFDEMQKTIKESRKVIEGLDQFKKDITDLYNTDFGPEEN